MSGRRRAAGVAMVLAALVTACGVPDEGRARRAAPDDVPFRLLETERSPAPTSVQPDGAAVTIFLTDADGERLVPVERRIEERSVDDLVDALLAGPTEAEASLGLGTALDDPSAVRSVRTSGGAASVDLSADFTAIDGATQLMAVAQLVYTLTAQPGIGRVGFSVAGRSVEIPRGDGTLTSGSVSRDSYSELVTVPS